MYTPAHFNEPRVDVLYDFVRQHPLGALVTVGPSGIEASHVPMVLELSARGDAATTHCVLRFHLARANPQARVLADSGSALVIFQGAEHYITPSWYASKQEHGKVVPTWNYIAVHVWGRARVIDDPQRMLHHLHELTDAHELGREAPWKVDDAPPDYIARQMGGIVGFELTIERIEGKWKMSQNRPEADQAGVIAGLEELGSAASVEVAEAMKGRRRS